MEEYTTELVEKISAIIEKYNLTPEEIFSLCKSISEEKLSPGDELYEYYHNEDNERKWISNAGPGEDKGT